MTSTSAKREELRVHIVASAAVPRRGCRVVLLPSLTYADVLATARIMFSSVKWRVPGTDGALLSGADVGEAGLFLVSREQREVLGSLQDAEVAPYGE
jgi:hypothetical protein